MCLIGKVTYTIPNSVLRIMYLNIIISICPNHCFYVFDVPYSCISCYSVSVYLCIIVYSCPFYLIIQCLPYTWVEWFSGSVLVEPEVEVGEMRVPVCGAAAGSRLASLVCTKVGQDCGLINYNHTHNTTEQTGALPTGLYHVKRFE